MKSVFALLPFSITLMACSPETAVLEVEPEDPVLVTAAFRGLIMSPAIIPETGLLDITQSSLDTLYTAGNFSIVTNADGSVSARSA